VIHIIIAFLDNFNFVFLALFNSQ